MAKKHPRLFCVLRKQGLRPDSCPWLGDDFHSLLTHEWAYTVIYVWWSRHALMSLVSTEEESMIMPIYACMGKRFWELIRSDFPLMMLLLKLVLCFFFFFLITHKAVKSWLRETGSRSSYWHLLSKVINV